ncbi:MAG: potassium/proton antiporter [Dermatophilaceae bacterium]
MAPSPRAAPSGEHPAYPLLVGCEVEVPVSLTWPGADDTFGLPQLTGVLLLSAIVVLLALVAVRISARSGLPTLLLYLGLGLALGESGLGIQFSDVYLAQVLGYSALILILAEGGLTTRWSTIREVVAPAAVLSTVGVVVSVAVVGFFAERLLDLPWQVALLIGAVLASTDAAAVFAVLRSVALPRRLSGMLEAESGFNDAPAIILTTALSVQLSPTPEQQDWWVIALLALFELTAGAAIGLGVGWAGAQLVRRIAGASSSLYSLGVIAIAVIAYAVAAGLHTSGFIAVYLCGLVLGNMQLPHRAAVTGFAEALGSLSQVGLFVMLGLLASPVRLTNQLVPALVVGLVLLVVARPLSVLVSLTPFRIGIRDQLFVSWAGLRGAVPIVLATVPLTVGASQMLWLFDLVLVLVVVYTLIQAPTLPWVARLLRVTESVRAVAVNVETTPLEQLKADVLTVDVGPASKLHGVDILELRLPAGANVTLVVRGDTAFVPSSRTGIRHGDQLLIVTTDAAREATERRIVQVSRHGRLAGWVDRDSATRRNPT